MKSINYEVHYGLLVILEHEPSNKFIYKNYLSHLNTIKPWQTENVFSPCGLGCMGTTKLLLARHCTDSLSYYSSEHFLSLSSKECKIKKSVHNLWKTST